MTDRVISSVRESQLDLANKTYRRNRAVDGWRGVAILLMVAAHADLIFGGGGYVDGSIGRLAMPLFLMIAGACYSRLSRRVVLVIFAALLVQPIITRSLGAFPGILLVFSLLVPLFPVASRWPVPVAAVALAQLLAWPLPWYGYQPGALLLAWIVGHVGASYVRDLPTVPAFLEVVGRWPLTWYVAHLYAFVFVSHLTNIGA